VPDLGGDFYRWGLGISKYSKFPTTFVAEVERDIPQVKIVLPVESGGGLIESAASARRAHYSPSLQRDLL
jgi:hypothetical protein